MRKSVIRAAAVLQGGGVIACPTEGVYGLSCLPDDADAVRRLLAIKRRDPAMGLILIAAFREQLSDWIAIPPAQIPDPEPTRPVSWIVKAAPGVSPLVRGAHSGIAVRITTNNIAAAVCSAVASPLVSTSANLSGAPVARNQFVLRRQFAGRVDYIVAGRCGPASGPSEIRELETGKRLR